MIRTLSHLESKLVLFLEWEKKPFLTVKQAMDILSVSSDHIRVILHRLTQKGWLAPVVPGVYEFIPAERGEAAFVDTNPLALGSVLVEPYAFSFATAAYFYGLTTQASTTVYIETTKGKTRDITARSKKYRVITFPEHRFFAVNEVNAYGSKVQMVEAEKAVLDSIEHPEAAGDIPEIAAMIFQGKTSLDWPRLVDYALKFKSQSLVQRLGFLIDFLKIEIPQEMREHMLAEVKNNFCYLGRPRKWRLGGKHNPTWQVVVNISESELLAEIKIT
jgi:predicted transcriptional regulator of viral defense system